MSINEKVLKIIKKNRKKSNIKEDSEKKNNKNKKPLKRLKKKEISEMTEIIENEMNINDYNFDDIYNDIINKNIMFIQHKIDSEEDNYRKLNNNYHFFEDY
jgi:hypothetical protein